MLWQKPSAWLVGTAYRLKALMLAVSVAEGLGIQWYLSALSREQGGVASRGPSTTTRSLPWRGRWKKAAVARSLVEIVGSSFRGANRERPKSPEVSTRRNNFNLLRAAAASAVLFSHCYPLSLGAGTVEPLQSILGFTLGHLSVVIFFTISGFFISQSFARSSGVFDFWLARILRIYPALFACLLLTISALGPLVTAVPTYWIEPDTYAYLVRGLRLFANQNWLPGCFENSPFPRAVNGSLWTLFYEVACYGMAMVVGISVALNRRAIPVLFIASTLAYIAVWPFESRLPNLAHNFFELAPPFIIGMAFFYFRIELNHIGALLAMLAALAAYKTPVFREVFYASLGYIIFYLGHGKLGILQLYNRLGDYSYGIYIYAFPVQQATVHFSPGIGPMTLFAIAAPTALAMSIASWHCLEKPMLDKRRTWTVARLGQSLP